MLRIGHEEVNNVVPTVAVSDAVAVAVMVEVVVSAVTIHEQALLTRSGLNLVRYDGSGCSALAWRLVKAWAVTVVVETLELD